MQEDFEAISEKDKNNETNGASDFIINDLEECTTEELGSIDLSDPEVDSAFENHLQEEEALEEEVA